MQTSVQIRSIETYDLKAIEAAVACWFAELKDHKLSRSKRVFLKPNLLGAFSPEKAVTTHPIVLEALIRYFISKKKEVWVGDSSGGTVNVQTVWDVCGLQDLANRYPIKLVNLSTIGFKEVKYNGVAVKVSDVLSKCGIVINVAKLKTHSLMAYTGALKNLYGLVPGMVKSEYHRMYPDTNSFSNLLLSLYGIAKPKITYSIIDGIVGMDGAGPSAGNPKNFGVLLGSSSVSALDAVASKMMGFQISDVPYLSGALHHDGILPSKIAIPQSFRHHVMPKADIRAVKMRKDMLKYIPLPIRFAFQKIYYYYPVVTPECKRCGICVKSCPVKAISWLEDGYPRVNKDACIKCMCCHEMCPHHAIAIHKSFIAKRILG